MELREIEVFLVLADELHFGRTAQRLYVSQSRVSQTVRALEARVGGRLFERTSRRVRLTALGEQLRDRLRPGYDQLNRAFAEVRALATGITGELRISLLSLAAGGPRFSEFVRSFSADHPGCAVSVYEAFPGEALARLCRGELDVMAHWLPLSRAELTIGPTLVREPRALAVPVGHPLAVRGSASLEDLGDHEVVDSTGVVPAETVEELCPARTPSGRPIRRRHREGRMAEVLALVARGEVVHPTVASLPDYYAHPGVTTVPLTGLTPLRGALVWVTGRESAAVRALAEIAARLSASSGPA